MFEKVTTGNLSKVITDCSGMKESLQRFIHDPPELKNAMPLLDDLLTSHETFSEIMKSNML